MRKHDKEVKKKGVKLSDEIRTKQIVSQLGVAYYMPSEWCLKCDGADANVSY